MVGHDRHTTNCASVIDRECGLCDCGYEDDASRRAELARKDTELAEARVTIARLTAALGATEKGKRMTTRIEAEPEMNAPKLDLDGPLCSCTRCYEARRDKPREDIGVRPWSPSHPKAREMREPVAVLEYGGVRIELDLTYVHAFTGSFDPRSPFAASRHVFTAALGEIEQRMWDDARRTERDREGAKGGGRG